MHLFCLYGYLYILNIFSFTIFLGLLLYVHSGSVSKKILISDIVSLNYKLVCQIWCFPFCIRSWGHFGFHNFINWKNCRVLHQMLVENFLRVVCILSFSPVNFLNHFFNLMADLSIVLTNEGPLIYLLQRTKILYLLKNRVGIWGDFLKRYTFSMDHRLLLR